jgi:hypothetical protein
MKSGLLLNMILRNPSGCLAQEVRISKSSAETSHKCKIVKELSGIDM